MEILQAAQVPALLRPDEVGQLSKPPQSRPQTPRGTVLRRRAQKNNTFIDGKAAKATMQINNKWNLLPF